MGFQERGRLVPDSVLGCRRWNVERDGTLHSYSAKYLWEPGWHTASCNWGGTHHLGNPAADYGKHCGCGFWAYWDENGEHVKIPAGSSAVAGIIEGRGPALVGYSGFRISEARIVALVWPPMRRSL